jgi:tyrosyl-tRNA synthetase
MNIKEKIGLMEEVGEEIIGLEEIIVKMKKGKKLIAYDGFEPSGKIHIAQGFVRALNIQKLIKAGIHFKVLIADWHAYANNKMGGDMEKIQQVGKYFIEVWKACGLDTNDIEFVWASDLVRDPKYWFSVLKIARSTTLNRIIRCSQIMGRSETDNLTAAQIIYPAMQAADIFYLKADIAQLGMDQRKVNMLARQIAPDLGYEKPAAVHHHMLISLNPPIDKLSEGENKIEKTIALKMSKSQPDSAVFMTDTHEEIRRKINKAYCPPKEMSFNPILEYYRYIVFLKFKKVKIKREDKFGGDLLLNSYQELEDLYKSEKIYPLDLKNNLVDYLDEIIEPVRKYFELNSKAKSLKEEIESYKVTR